MTEVVSDFHGELNDVLSKVNSWALGREKELLSLQAEHTAFLDTHNGADARQRAPCHASPARCMRHLICRWIRCVIPTGFALVARPKVDVGVQT